MQGLISFREIRVNQAVFGRVVFGGGSSINCQAAGSGVMVWGTFSRHTLGPLVPIEHRLNATA